MDSGDATGLCGPGSFKLAGAYGVNIILENLIFPVS
jgi:hypothetical protein